MNFLVRFINVVLQSSRRTMAIMASLSVRYREGINVNRTGQIFIGVLLVALVTLGLSQATQILSAEQASKTYSSAGIIKNIGVVCLYRKPVQVSSHIFTMGHA